jgi:hypothetical protein
MPNNDKEGLFNPYQGIDLEVSAKATAVLDKADLLLLKGLNPQRGLIQNLINMFLHSLVEELREKEIFYYTPDNEREFIRIVRRRTVAGTSE